MDKRVIGHLGGGGNGWSSSIYDKIETCDWLAFHELTEVEGNKPGLLDTNGCDLWQYKPLF